MRIIFVSLFCLMSMLGITQTAVSVTSPEVDNIMRGLYTPSTYTATTVITNANSISSEIISRVSRDSLQAYLFKLRSFETRNVGSDTVSNVTGIGAARRWVMSKLNAYSALNDNRLRTAYLQFTLPSGTGCGQTSHRNIMGVLPGSQVVDKAILIIEAHIDSRNASLCDVSGSAMGMEDNATGTALVLELARIMSKYTFRNTILFSINTGEEQGKLGAQALADYCQSKSIKIRAVSNNDVSGGTFCGHTSSGPSCPFFGHIDSVGLRIFSLNTTNSPYKQWARYLKLEYKEMAAAAEPVPTDVRIMTAEDRTGRGGDHQPFSAMGYTSVRLTAANENGDASNGTGYADRQHNISDSLGRDLNSDGIEDSLYVSVSYLRRNAIVNGIGLAMNALVPDTVTLSASMLPSSAKVKVQMTAGFPAYRIAIRSATNDWDSVFTITGKTLDTVTVPYASSTTFFISASGVDAQNIETQFSTEYILATPNIILALEPLVSGRAIYDRLYGISLLQNKPNPFDESTMIIIKSASDQFANRTWVNIMDMNGKIVQHVKVNLRKGINEVLYNHGYMKSGTYIYSLLIDGLIVESRKMVFSR